MGDSDPAAEHDDDSIDPELWLQYVLFATANEADRQALIAYLVKKTHLSPEHIEIILQTLLEALLTKAHSN